MTRLFGRYRAWWRCRAGSTRSWIRCRRTTVCNVRPRVRVICRIFPSASTSWCSGAAQQLDAKISRDVDRTVACGGGSTTARVRRTEHRIRGVRGVHVARMRFYAGAALAITIGLKGFFEHVSRRSLRWQRLCIWRMPRLDVRMRK